MPYIHLTIFIASPAERVFNLSRSIDVHKDSMKKYQETIINGMINGLMGLNDPVTWKARHFFKDRVMKVRITEMKIPDFFVDEQVLGPFKMMKHEHYFKTIQNGTLMIDQFRYEGPKTILGKLAGTLFLEKYITRLLNERNEFIKKIAESNEWEKYLNK